MAHTSRIRTPLRQHWNRFRLGALPILSFLLCIAVTLWLWQRQAMYGSIVGEVEAYQVDVTAGIDGLLIAPEQNYWHLLDKVKQNQVLARLDDTALRADLLAVQAESERLRAEVQSAIARMKLDQDQLTQNHTQNRLRLTWELEQRRVERLQQAAVIKEDMTTLKGIQASLDLLEGLAQRQAGLFSPAQLTDLRQQRDVLNTRIQDNRDVLVEIDKQFRDAQKRLEEFPDLDMAESDDLLAPIREGIKVQEAIMETINVQIENLVIRSPVDGTITAIYRWPGQRIAAGDLICSLFREDAQYVVSYVREQQRIRPYKGMEVSLRLRAPGSPEYRSSVESVGPPAAPVPPRHLRDQAVLEWATPVKIPIPPELQSQNLEPGQLLQVIFDDNS